MSEITRCAIGMPFGMAMGSELSRRQFHSIDQEVLVEREQLRAEVAGLKTGYESYERVNAELRSECEKLRKDAERYRALRAPAAEKIGVSSPFVLDALVDAAMSKEASHD